MRRLAWRRAQRPAKRRRRTCDEPVAPLPHRLKQLAERARRDAAELPPGKEREDFLLKATQADNVLEFVRLLRR
ncbi:hypothetical protein GCM10010987_21860 [Bradyrhizobium guangdongense]|uniref:Uncharacterized protein n=1 Tax=Bradyrhizobium guangdongense TaxID=1325090 RepID=A0AA87W5Z6_9BRAD|nr:hypothetical protein GCM10010987_21860 [Bradyrhizobium guangdongense]